MVNDCRFDVSPVNNSDSEEFWASLVWSPYSHAHTHSSDGSQPGPSKRNKHIAGPFLPYIYPRLFKLYYLSVPFPDRSGAVARSDACSLGMQAAPSSIPTSGTFFRGDLVMKTFLRPFSLFCWFKKSSCQLLAKECALSFWLCWGLTSQSTIFQSCRDGATAFWVINQYFWGVKWLALGHIAAVGFEPPTSRSGVRHSTTEPPRSPVH